jgi:hypothetical protein
MSANAQQQCTASASLQTFQERQAYSSLQLLLVAQALLATLQQP